MSELRGYIVNFLKLLADETRLTLLELLREGEKTAKELEQALGKSQSTVSKHLSSLLEQNVIEAEKRAIQVEEENKKEVRNLNFYKLKHEELNKLLAHINAFVIRINREKLKDLRELNLDIYDILL